MLFYLTIRKNHQRWWNTLLVYDEYFQAFELGLWSKWTYLMVVKNSNSIVYISRRADERKHLLLWSITHRIFNHKIEVQKHRKKRPNASNIALKIPKQSLPAIESQEDPRRSRRIPNKKLILNRTLEHLWIPKNLRPPIESQPLHLRPQNRP